MTRIDLEGQIWPRANLYKKLRKALRRPPKIQHTFNTLPTQVRFLNRSALDRSASQTGQPTRQVSFPKSNTNPTHIPHRPASWTGQPWTGQPPRQISLLDRSASQNPTQTQQTSKTPSTQVSLPDSSASGTGQPPRRVSFQRPASRTSESCGQVSLWTGQPPRQLCFQTGLLLKLVSLPHKSASRSAQLPGQLSPADRPASQTC